MIDPSYRRLAVTLLLAALHSLAAYVSVAMAFLLESPITEKWPAAGRNDTVVGHFIESPVWGLGIICAFALGCAVYLILRSNSALFAWWVPVLLLIWNVLTWPSSGSGSVSDTFFTADCGGSECVYQLLVTAPFYASVAYAFGALVISAFFVPKHLPGVNPAQQ